VGSTPELGEWQLSKALKLIWSEGHIWKRRINVTYRANMTLPVSKFEFKFVVMRNNDPNQAIWESNPNHRFDLLEYIK